MKNSEAKILSGIAGEYFVAGELSRRGYIASITLRNTANIDILASNGEKTANIQVKTKCIERSKVWDLGNKSLKYKKIKNNTFYVLVEISSDSENKEVSYYIIPKKELHKEVEQRHLFWLKGKNKITGKKRKSQRRTFRIETYPEFQTKKYKDNWAMLFE